MSFKITASNLFYSQLKLFKKKRREVIKSKILLIKQNPYRYKSLKKLKLFRVRFSENNKDIRLIYAVEKDTVFLIGFFDRKNNYQDVKKWVKEYL
jgi:mRNA-degrading endonuclease RelE of RelBE toxin-antitoxin system